MKHSSDSYLLVHNGITQVLKNILTSCVLATLREHRADLIYTGVMPNSGWFHITQNRLADKLLIKENKTIRKHIQTLEEFGFVETKLEGLPQRMFYLLNDEIYNKANREGTELLQGINKDLTNNSSRNK